MTGKVLTELQIACWFNDLPKVNQLIAGGANVNFQNALGRTALHYASGREDIEKLLIANGADWDIKDVDGLSAGDMVLPGRNGNPNRLWYTSIRERQSLERNIREAAKELDSKKF